MWLEWRLSGGAANTLPANALGGAMSSQAVTGEELAFHSGAALAGVSVLGGFGHRDDSSGSAGSAHLTLFISENGVKHLIYTPSGVAAGTLAADFGNVRAVTSDESFGLSFGRSGVTLAVTVASLPAVRTEAALDVSHTARGLFGDSVAGASHRCVYLRNAGASAVSVRVFLAKLPAGSVAALGLDPAGVGGTATTIASQATAPAGVTFSRPIAAAAGVALTLPAGSHAPLWLRRTAPAAGRLPVTGDSLAVGVVLQ
jgi:hypothetical protein